MKASILKAMALGIFGVQFASAISLYDTAPAIGMPESHAVRYSVSLSMGWDDNLNNANGGKTSGCYSSFSAGASYADYESVDRISYSATVGGRIYSDKAYGTDQNIFSNIGLSFSHTRLLDNGDTNAVTLSLAYTPEPDYSNSIHSPLSQGDVLTWNIHDSYSHAIDGRWSVSGSVGYNGILYSERNYSHDDREYINCSLNLNYKASLSTSYSLGVSWRNEMRHVGMNSRSYYLTGTVNHAIDAVSSCSLTAGAQVKSIDGRLDVYPSLRFGYNRQLADKLSAQAYVSYDNENLDTWNGYSTYRSSETLRFGATMTYVYTPVVSFNGGFSYVMTRQSSNSAHASSRDRDYGSLTVGMSYRWSESVSSNITYTYNTSSGTYSYERNTVSAGVTYSF